MWIGRRSSPPKPALLNNMTSQTLITLRAVSNGALVAEQLPTRLKILDWGRNATVKGTILVDDETAKSFEERQQSAGHGEIAIDFEHNTVAGSPEYERTKEPRVLRIFYISQHGIKWYTSQELIHRGRIHFEQAGTALVEVQHPKVFLLLLILRLLDGTCSLKLMRL